MGWWSEAKVDGPSGKGLSGLGDSRGWKQEDCKWVVNGCMSGLNRE